MHDSITAIIGTGFICVISMSISISEIPREIDWMYTLKSW